MMSQYLKLINISTPYATRMTRLRNRIFGDVVKKTDKRSFRVVEMFKEQPIYKQNDVINYYPRHVDTHYFMLKLRAYGLYRDEHQDFKEEMRKSRIARGKVKPKKGQGKQAQNK